MRADELRGHLDAVLMSIIDEGPAHGYAILESLRDRTDGSVDLPTGTVYPALHRLERAKLISSEWSTVDGRRRRTYILTPHGRKSLSLERAQWHSFVSTVSSLLASPPAMRPDATGSIAP
ncbi:MAG TPA: helix-turn-helix transcriptional regulator [Acidimicrobiales bacterium]|jgi:DNA-binding PadR family transcriptional regulator|nr:helix-turn-helix transcriptional regulator [Acidimicrobiales bacterium]